MQFDESEMARTRTFIDTVYVFYRLLAISGSHFPSPPPVLLLV